MHRQTSEKNVQKWHAYEEKQYWHHWGPIGYLGFVVNFVSYSFRPEISVHDRVYYLCFI
jgi:hypothetical protein